MISVAFKTLLKARLGMNILVSNQAVPPTFCNKIAPMAVPICKNKNLPDAGNYRPFSLATPICKLFEHYILSCISPFVVTTDNHSLALHYNMGLTCVFCSNRISFFQWRIKHKANKAHALGRQKIPGYVWKDENTHTHRCRSRQIFKGAKDFCPNFPKFAWKNFGPLLARIFSHEDRFSDDLQQKKRSSCDFGRHFFQIKARWASFCLYF